MVLYHGTLLGGLREIRANAASHTLNRPVAYFTEDRVYALVCCRKREENFVTMGSRDDGKQHYFERFPNQLKILYQGRPGFLYKKYSAAGMIHTKGRTWESASNVPVNDCEAVDDVYDEILREALLGNVVVHRYEEIDPKEQREMAEHIRTHLDDPGLAGSRDFLIRYFSPLWDDGRRRK